MELAPLSGESRSLAKKSSFMAIGSSKSKLRSSVSALGKYGSANSGADEEAQNESQSELSIIFSMVGDHVSINMTVRGPTTLHSNRSCHGPRTRMDGRVISAKTGCLCSSPSGEDYVRKYQGCTHALSASWTRIVSFYGNWGAGATFIINFFGMVWMHQRLHSDQGLICTYFKGAPCIPAG